MRQPQELPDAREEGVRRLNRGGLRGFRRAVELEVRSTSGDRRRDPLHERRLRHDNAPERVSADDLVRMYFVNVGPGVSAAHVIGTVFDRVYAGTPWIQGVQSFPVSPGAGAILEFYIPEAGVFPFVDHDKLAYLPFGLALAFATEGVAGAAH